jgi:alkylation response protein AidB-like acyl-CoA dehydrogenase
MGRSPYLAPEALNCSAPDTGNMEILELFGTEEHKGTWLKPLLAGEIRSAFAMTEPAVAGPGRIHHCMRSIGMAESALELMVRRAAERVTFGEPLSARANIQDWIAEARIEVEMIRLLTLKTAWLMDTVANQEARTEIAAIKGAAPRIALKVIDRAIEVHGAAGLTEDFPLAAYYAYQRVLRIADGPDEVHLRPSRVPRSAGTACVSRSRADPGALRPGPESMSGPGDLDEIAAVTNSGARRLRPAVHRE